jgi:hypothetical protein
MLLSLLIVLGMALGIVLWVWVAFPTLLVVRVVTRSFWCRFRKRNVSAEFQECSCGQLIDVTRCTAFEPSSSIACEKDCLRLQQLDPIRDSDEDAERTAKGALTELR